MQIPEDTQTSLERVLSYLQGVNPQRIACFPLILNHASRAINVPVSKCIQNAELFGKAHVAAYRRYGNDLITFLSSTSSLAEAMGQKMNFIEDDAPQLADPLVKQLEDIERVKIPDFSSDGRLPVYLGATELRGGGGRPGGLRKYRFGRALYNRCGTARYGCFCEGPVQQQGMGP